MGCRLARLGWALASLHTVRDILSVLGVLGRLSSSQPAKARLVVGVYGPPLECEM